MIDTLLRYRLWLIGAAALLNGVLDSLGVARNSDFFLLEGIARGLFSAQALHVLDQSWVQLGPLALLWPATNAVVHDVTHVSAELLFSVTVYLGVTFGTLLLVRALYRDTRKEVPAWVELCAGLSVLVAGVGWTAVSSGQPFDAVVGVLWILVARAAIAGRPVTAGVLLGVAGAVKLSAVLGVPLLLLLPGLRRRLGGAAIAAAVTGIFYLPFFVWGESGMFEFSWTVARNTLVAWVVEPGTDFTWEMRLVQSVVVVALGAWAVVALRRSPHVVWAAPFVIAVARVAADPLSFSYYWLGAEVIAIAGIAMLLTGASVPARVALIAGYIALGLALLVPGAANPLRFGLAALLIGYLATNRSPSSVEETPAPV